MTQGTERLSIYGAVNLLECHEFEPPPRFEGDTMEWFREEVQAGRLVCHDHTGRKIEPGERRGLLLGLYGETTSIEHLNSWLASIGHLRRVPCEDAPAPAPAPEPASAPSTGRIDDVLIDAALKGMSEAGLRELRAVLELMHREEGIQRQIPPAHILEAAERVRRVCGPTPVASQAPAPSEHTSAPAVAAAPTPAPSASAPTVAAPEPAQKQKKPRRSWWDDVIGYLAEVLRAGKHRTARALHDSVQKLAGGQDSPFKVVCRKLYVNEAGQTLAVKTLQNRWAEVRAAAGMR